MALVYLSLGSNLGNSLGLLQQAICNVQSLPGVSDFLQASYYETAPVEACGDRYFVNTACRFEYDGTADGLLGELQNIERHYGKVPKRRNEPRLLDIDILFFGMERREDAILTLPHPRWKERLFVLVPLSELTDAVQVPEADGAISMYAIEDIIAQCPNRSEQMVSELI